MNLYCIGTFESLQLAVAENRSKASRLVLKEFQCVSFWGLDNPGYIQGRRLLLRDVEGPARYVCCYDERALVERGFGAIGKTVEWIEDSESLFIAYEPKDRKCYTCGRTGDLSYIEGVWQCVDWEACFQEHERQAMVSDNE